MINIEERLIELFESIPAIEYNGKDYSVSLEVGNDKDLNRFLNSKRKEKGTNIYPLLWVQTPIQADLDIQFVEAPIRLVIATLTNDNLSNKQRLKTTFKDVLNPTLGNVLTALRESGFTQIINDEYIRTNFFNYGTIDNTKHVTTDIWDAILLECRIRIDSNCLQKIIYTYGN